MNKKLIAVIAAVIVAIIMFLIPTPAGFEPLAWQALAFLVPVIILWATEAVPVGIASVLFLVVVVIAKIAPASVAFSGFGNHLTYLMMGAFALSTAMISSGLSKRLSFFLLSKASGMWSLVFAGYLCNILMIAIPSSSARGGILAPVLSSVMDSVDRPMKSNFSRFVTYNFITATNNWTGPMFMTGGAANGVMIGLYQQFTGNTLGWVEWLVVMAVPMIVLTVILVVGSYFIGGRPEKEYIEKIKDTSSIKAAYKALGKMSIDEIKVLIAFVLAIVLWALGETLQLSAGWAAVIVMTLLFLPQVGVLTPKSLRQLNWDIIILIGSVMGLGTILANTGLIANLGDVIFNPILTPFSALGLVGIALAVIIISLIAHFILPSPSNVTLVTPIMITWAASMGLDPAVMLAFVGLLTLMNDKIIFLAYQMPPYYVYLGMDVTDTGRFNNLLMKMYPVGMVAMVIGAFLAYFMINITGFGL